LKFCQKSKAAQVKTFTFEHSGATTVTCGKAMKAAPLLAN